MVKMSVCPSTSTPCCSHTCWVVSACTASTSPACTEVRACGARMPWKIWRLNRGGTLARAADVVA